jgi:hypothetical protein
MAVERYRAELQIDVDASPLDYWKVHAGAHPTIARLAMKYLATPATTVPCERLFSLAGNVVNKKRAALSPSSVDNLVSLSNQGRI